MVISSGVLEWALVAAGYEPDAPPVQSGQFKPGLSFAGRGGMFGS
jgi:hypothetical protein